MRRNPPAKWVLPDVVNPANRKCFCLSVPDDPAYIAAYRGAIQALASAYNWQDDDAHTAREVALVMRDCIDDGECSNMEFIQRDCDLFVVVGGVETLIYTAQTCIDNNIADGKLAVANSGHIGDYGSSQCYTYTVKVTPSQNWIAPNVVNSGDTLLLSNWHGGATDLGMLSTTWVCPSGTAYIFDHCADTARAATIYGTDPLQTAPHLAVIAQIGNAYYDVWNSVSGVTPATFTVPAGIVNQPLRLMINVGTLVANVATGEMWGEVTICNNSEWCYEADFTISNDGWVAVPGYASYSAGNGWVPITTSPPYDVYPPRAIDIKFVLAAPVYIVTITMYVNPVDWGTSTAGGMGWTNGGGALQDYAHYTSPHVFSVNETISDYLEILKDKGHVDGEDYDHSVIKKLRITGRGVCPFGTPNCS